MKLDAYTIVLLRRPKDAPEMSDVELEALQRDHVAFNARMREACHALVSGPFAGKPDESLLIWTTTPWTLPANLAIAAHPDFRYAKVKIPHGKKPEYVWLMESAVPAPGCGAQGGS